MSKEIWDMLVQIAKETEARKKQELANPMKQEPRLCPQGCGRYRAVNKVTGLLAPYCTECRRRINKDYRKCANKKR